MGLRCDWLGRKEACCSYTHTFDGRSGSEVCSEALGWSGSSRTSACRSRRRRGQEAPGCRQPESREPPTATRRTSRVWALTNRGMFIHQNKGRCCLQLVILHIHADLCCLFRFRSQNCVSFNNQNMHVLLFGPIVFLLFGNYLYFI